MRQDYKRPSASGQSSHPGSARTASIVSQLLLSDSAPALAAARMSISCEAQARRVGLYTVTVEEIGFFRKAVPTMPKAVAWVCLFLNVVLPGIGTLMSAFACLRGAKTSYKTEKRTKAFCVNTLAAFLQLLTVPIIIGIIWSIMWGMTFVRLSRREPEK